MSLESSYAFMYLELNIVATILVVMILVKTNGMTKMVSQIDFSLAILSQIVFFWTDTVCVMMRCSWLPYIEVLFMLSKSLYFLSCVTMCFFWFLYFENIHGSLFSKERRRLIESSILVALMIVLIVINFFNGMMFYIEDGVYKRGKLFVISYVIAYIYAFTASGRLFMKALSEEERSLKLKYVLHAILPVLVAMAGVFQFKYPNIPVACVTLALATFYMYTASIDDVVSIDPLTLLNNRKQLAYYYNQYSSHRIDGMDMYLLMIDANRFKSINDTYGHIQGDAALVRIACALKDACRQMQRRYNIARYGGDEFVLIMWAEDDSVISRLCTNIDKRLDELNKESQAPYELSVSIGITKKEDKEDITLKSLVNRADEKLYEAKEKLR